MEQAHAQVETSSASRLVTRLCRHFGRTDPVRWDETRGRIAFASGRVDLVAEGGGLSIEIEAETEDHLAALKTTITRHLVLFSFHDRPVVHWRHGRERPTP